MNVWKIASRWSDNGDPNSSVLDIFRKYQVAFAGRERDYIQNYVKVGDLVAVSDGIVVVAIGKVTSDVRPVTAFIDEDQVSGRFDCEDWVVAFKIKLIHLDNEDMFEYRQGTFHAVYDPYRSKVISLFDKYQKKFAISAQSCTIKYNDQKNGHVILDSETKYFIPIYQRPYSWSDKEIRQFISDLFLSFWGVDGTSESEPMFIGTMQLSDKKFIKDKYFEQDIIDGQQRLTTILILMKLLKSKAPTTIELEPASFNWLETRVNNGEQQKSFLEFLENPTTFSIDTLNKYQQNAFLINELLDEQFKDDSGLTNPLDVENFIHHLLSKVYFVVIETYAGLSKTLQIFNSINTTGLDLNGGDIFKLRMYEYLRDVESQDERAFQDISKVYEKIEIGYKDTGDYFYNINFVLRIYQYVLIGKYDLPNTLFSLATDTFFERLFESIFKINKWENFTNLNELKLDLNELNKIITVFDKWESMSYPSVEDNCMEYFTDWSRYGRFGLVKFLFIYRFIENPNMEESLFLFLRNFGKLIILYSVLFQKSIGEINTFNYTLIKNLINDKPFESLIDDIKNKINSSTWYKGDNKEAFYELLEGNVVYNAKMKNLVCWLSAMLEENYTSSAQEEIDRISNNLFHSGIDVDHIQPDKDKDHNLRQDIYDTWGENLHCVGNLVILDSSTNRSQQNAPYLEKRDNYHASDFQIVQNIANTFENWDLSTCLNRKDKEIQKLVSYIF